MKHASHRRAAFAACAVFALTLMPWAAPAQDYPTKPIRIIVIASAGGPADLLARTFAEKLTERLKQQSAIVENKAGAGGAIAADYVAKSPPDGYTLLLGIHSTQSIHHHLNPNIAYNPETDFAPIIHIATVPNVLFVPAGSPVKSVQELVAQAKAKPGSMSFASQGPGSTGHLVGELFRLASGTDLIHVPYRGAAPALQDLIAGNVTMMWDTAFALSHVREGRLRALAVTSPQRMEVIPDVPTTVEVGLPEIHGGAWFALLAPAKTPPAVIAFLNRHANEIFALPDVRQRFVPQGVILPRGTPEQLQALIDADSKRWGDVIRKANIKIE
jgi:tripartite-type tricarboxylate transporter receptor subunit TctC